MQFCKANTDNIILNLERKNLRIKNTQQLIIYIIIVFTHTYNDLMHVYDDLKHL